MPYSSEHHDVNQVLEETRYTLDAALSPTRVLLAVHVKGEPDADGLSTFISDAGTEQDENALRVEAIYRSSRDAVLFLVTAPLAVWQLLPDHGGCQFVSLMMGGNLWSASSKAGAEQKRTAEVAIFSSRTRQEGIRATNPVHHEIQLNEPLPTAPPPPYSQRDVLAMD